MKAMKCFLWHNNTLLNLLFCCFKSYGIHFEKKTRFWYQNAFWHFYHNYLLLLEKLQFLLFLQEMTKYSHDSNLRSINQCISRSILAWHSKWPMIEKWLLKDDRAINFTIRASQYSPNSYSDSLFISVSRNRTSFDYDRLFQCYLYFL